MHNSYAAIILVQIYYKECREYQAKTLKMVECKIINR
ncbi:MAG: hypothetical protein ACJASQ_000551 [Crocinitomicaceae bacterium]|jgi:hypothetical protein